MQLFQLLLVLQVLGSQLLGEVSLSHIGDCFVESVPVQLFNQFLDIFPVTLGFPVNALLDLDDQREVILLTF